MSDTPKTEVAVRQPKPQGGIHIVWRFKGNKGWTKGYVHTVLSKGKILDIRGGQYASSGDLVALEDIDWFKQ